jgi:hypothetical protein
MAVVSLASAGAFVQYCKHVLGKDFLLGLVPLFDLGTDNSIPTWYSSITLLICSILLTFIFVVKRASGDRFARSWGLLAFIFVFLSVDEVARIHETIGEVYALNISRPTNGWLFYTWVIPGTAFVLVMAAAYLKFLVNLPARTRALFVISGAIYVGGALGIEMINARNAYLNPAGSFAQSMMTTLEEFFEMAGIAVFLYALLSYIAGQVPESRTLTIQVGKNADP